MLLVGHTAKAQHITKSTQPTVAQMKRADQFVKNQATSLAFETNVFGGSAQYNLTTPQATLQFATDGVQFGVLAKPKTAGDAPRMSAWKMRWLNANAGQTIRPHMALHDKGVYSYIDKRGSHRIDRYAELWYDDVYPQTDLRFYGRGKTDLEYDFVVKPGGQPDAIRLAFDGLKGLSVSVSGELTMKLPVGDLKKAKPYAYQTIRGEEKVVDVRYKLLPDQTLGFEVGNYDPTQPLVIDPVVILWSTFLGGTGDENNGGIVVDDQGFIYLTGTTKSGSGFPSTTGISQPPASFWKLFVTKLNPDGNQVLWSTILDSHVNENNVSLAVGTDNKPVILAYIPGGFPPSYTSPGAFQPVSAGDDDAYIAKLSADGGTIEWATYFGGSGSDIPIYGGPGRALGIDASNTIYFGGNTKSTNLPTTSGSFQPGYQGGSEDSFVASFSPTGSLRWSTYLGGSEDDYSSSLTVEPDGTVYHLGVTESVGAVPKPFPVTVSYIPPGYTLLFAPAVITKLTGSGNVSAAALYPYTAFVGAGILTNNLVADANGLYFAPVTTLVKDAPIPFTGPLPPGATANSAVQSLVAVDKTTLGVTYVRAVANVPSETYYSVIPMATDGQGNLAMIISGWGSTINLPQYLTPDACITSFSPTPNASTNPSYLTTLNTATGATQYASFININAFDAPNPSNQMVLKGCNLYAYSTTKGNNAPYYPWTPSAYDANGNVITGYSGPHGNNQDLLLAKFGPTKLKTNTLTFAGSGTTYCINSAVPAITGNDASLNLDIPATNQAPQCPPAVFYQWQQAGSAGGPWTNVTGATDKDYAPVCTGGNTFYRRVAYCASNWLGGVCKDSLISSSVQVNCSGSVTHTTNIGAKPYARCANQPFTQSFAVVPGPDGAQAPYAYYWTRPNNTTVASGTIAASGTSPIPTNFSIDGTYYLYARDARGCVSVDTLVLTTLNVSAASSATLITCGASSIKLGPASPPDLSNGSLSFLWNPATGLSASTILNPTLTTSVIPSGSSATYTLTATLDGQACPATSVVVSNTAPAPLPALPSLTACQSQPLTLGQGITADPSLTYQWVPGLGIADGTIVPTVLQTGSLAPAAVNNYTYYLTAQTSSGCSLTTSQNVTIYKTPNYGLSAKYPAIICPTDPASTATYSFGTPAEAGISYTWSAVVSATATDAATPTNAQAVALLNTSTASQTTFTIPSGVVFPNGSKSKQPYKISYIRTSFNAANPACSRTDTVEIAYVPGCGPGAVPYCELSLPAGAQGLCASPDVKIGPAQAAAGVQYFWAPLTNLRDAVTNTPLSGTGPFSAYVIASPTATTSYTLTGVYPGGQTCRLEIKVFAGAGSLPSQNIPANATTCPGQPVTIGSAAISGYDYLWVPPTGLSSTTMSQPTFTPGSSGVYTVKITDRVTTCSIVKTVNLQVKDVPVPVLTNGQFCRTTGATSINLGQAGSASYNYSWSVLSGTATINSPNSSITTASIPAQTTNVVFQLTVMDPVTSCSKSVSLTYSSVTGPAITLATPLVSCAGGTINIGSEDNSPTLTYAWSSASAGNGLTVGEASKRNPQVTPTGTGPWTYSLTASFNGSCPTNAVVTVNPTVVPTVNTVSGAPCSASGVLLAVTNPGSVSSDWVFSWSPGTGILSPPVIPSPNGTTTNDSIRVYPSTATSYTLTATAAGGCVQKYVFNVPGPAYTAQANPAKICLPGATNPTVGLSNSIPGGATVSWTTLPGYTNPTTGRISNNASANPTFLVTDNPPAGVYKYLITVNYGSGCSSTVEQDITVTSVTLAVVANQSVCAGNCVTIGSTVNGPYSYSWRSVPSTASGNATIQNPTNYQTLVCPAQTTTYEITATDGVSGCSLTRQVQVAVNPSPTLTVVPSLTACQNAQGTATINLTSAVTQTNGTVSYWQDAAATLIPVANPGAVGAGTYYVKATSANGCSTILPVTVSFGTLPAIAVATPTCRANSTYAVKFTVQPANAIVTANVGTVQADSVFNIPAGQVLTLTASLNGCVASTTVAAPNCCSITATLRSATVCAGQTATLTATGGSSYTFSNGVTNTTGTLTFTPASSTVVSVTVANSSGCTSTTSATVTVNNAILTPTVTAGLCQSATNTYSTTVVVTVNNPVGGQTLTIADGTTSQPFTTTAGTSNTFTMVFNSLVSDGNSHTVTASLPGCSTATATYTAPGSCKPVNPKLAIDKLVNKSKAKVGDVMTYTLVLTNVGSVSATNVVVRDSSTTGLRFLTGSATAPAGTTYTPGAPISTWTVGTLSVGQSLSLTFQAIADSSGILYNTATVPGDTAQVCTSVPVKVCAGSVYNYRLTAPAGRSSYRWFRDGVELLTQTSNVLDVTQPGSYSLAVDNVTGKCPDFSCCPFIVEEDTLPTVKATAIPVTCIGTTPQTNGQIILSQVNPAYTYQYSLGASFNPGASLSGAAQLVPANGVLVSNLANPVAAQAYTVRVYNSSGCFTDVTVMLQPTACSCPPQVCTPFVIQQTKKGKRIGG